ncbi:Zn-ribbon domain-containing OB-fold protein [Nocardia miyunensis]|uniref:Zn-ribbon domain-containing OB-fold protein n=1 Tax=Nocardia miyunensis TaxID=282684 RepID=UPI00083387C0|nr:zinc ribbon domain-containing protein [Nocardia miyunensis]
MAEQVFPSVPADLVQVVEQHGRAVAAGDNAAVLADFRPDRAAQLIASAALPPDLVKSELVDLRLEDSGLYAARIKYTAADGAQTVLRSRWLELPEGWRVTQVRNLPETPPRMKDTGPNEDGSDTPHWEGLRVGELRIPQCEDCANWIWPTRPICPRCHGFRVSWKAVEPTGTIFSWTRTWQLFEPEFSGHLPFVTVLAELPQAGGRRLLGVLLDADGVDPQLGQRVRAEIEAAPDGGWPVLRWRLSSDQ